MSKRPYLTDEELVELTAMVDGAIEFERVNNRPHGPRARRLYRLYGKLNPDGMSDETVERLNRQTRALERVSGGLK